MTVRNRMVTISIAIVLLGIFQPISARYDQRFINELKEVSKKNGYLQSIEEHGNDQYTIKFTFNRMNNIHMESEGDKRSIPLIYGRGM